MKLISLNTWGGRAGLEGLLAFIQKHRDADIFCFQEMWNGGEDFFGRPEGQKIIVDEQGVHPRLLQDIEKILPEHQSFFRPHYYDFYGLGLCIKRTLPLVEEGELFVYKERGYVHAERYGNHARNIQYVTFGTARGKRTVINFHGLWNGGGKTDTEDRLRQSDNIIAFIKTIGHPVILCGDFNLLPETQSIKKLEAAGLRNLIIEYGVTSTRTKLYTKEHRFADYVMVSEGITVTDFRVLPDEVSDHNAMLVEFE